MSVLLASSVALVFCVGCATSSVVVGKTRPSVRPEDVKIYLRPPAVFEEIALINSNNVGGSPFGEQAKVNTVMKRMKNEAAKLGANGLILQQVGDQNVGSMGSGTVTATATGNTVTGFGTGTSVNMRLKTGSAIAIYVPPGTP